MKTKRTISMAIVCVLLVTVLSAVMVYAPPPPDIPHSPFQEVIIVNTDPIPVDVTDTTLAVTLDEPIDVTLDEPIDVALDEPIDVTLDEPIDVTLDEPIEVTNPADEALNVAIPDGVEITNLDEIPETTLDVSGWLHTTQYGSTGWQEYPPPHSPEVLLYVETKGYRTIDIVLSESGANAFCNCSITWYIGEGTFLTHMYEAEKWLYVSDFVGPVHLSYDVMGTHLVITMQSGGGGTGEVMATYYMTT